MRIRLPVALSLGVALLLAACGSGAPATSAPSAGGEGGGGAASPTLAPAQPTSAPAGGGGFDPASIDMCQLLPRAELADLAGGTPYEGAETSGPACIYVIDPGDGTAELYSIGVFATDLIQASVDYVRQYEQAEWLEGIGDTAMLQPSDTEDGFDMSVLVEGAYGLSLSGPRSEVLQDVARLLIERLGG